MIKRIFNIFCLLVLVISLSTTTYAQSAAPAASGSPSEPVDEVKDLSFPITDLGGCSDYKACLTYCDDPVNNATCIDFAKRNGFYKDDPVLTPTDDFLTKTKDVLGCDSATACATFCGEPANYEACNAFAKSQGVLGGYVEEIADNSVILDE